MRIGLFVAGILISSTVAGFGVAIVMTNPKSRRMGLRLAGAIVLGWLLVVWELFRLFPDAVDAISNL